MLPATSVLRASNGLRRPIARSLVSHLQSRSTTTDAYKYVPGGPIYRGTVNDATPFPTPSKTHGSYHWAFERLLSASLVPITAAAAVTTGSQYPLIDAILGVSLVVHSHIGFESIRIDYLHSRKFPILGPVSKWLVRTATAGAVYGVFMFNTNDIGLCELITRVWHA
ncbi:mitochondrial inner membrane [Pyrrhoderma noxium]|uniref:Succinate dehydrogenase [ubiquinone] cytochrome b small subunit n=1 Tax=Pyrrhoderma noxium TaxID=2282107 RepID=A0A286UFN1_9AGAM|nr:mitochondrial inner membrane [Pyrrhoderma noxium]